MGRDFIFNKEQKRRIELINLIIYTVYVLAMAYILIQNNWPIWILLVVFVLSLIAWAMFLAQFQSYRVRIVIVSLLMLVGLFVYSTQCESLQIIFAPLVAVCIVMGLYGIPSLIYLSLFFSTATILMHIFVLRTVSFADSRGNLRFFFQVLAIYIAQFVIFYFEQQHLLIQNRMENTILGLKDAEKSKDDFLANVSHELRTPINTICGMSEIIMKKDMSRDIRTDIFQIQMAGRNLHSIVSDIFDFYELQYGNLELVEENYNISSTINNIINMSMARKNDKNIELIVDCDSSLPSGLIGDELKIRRVIMNLVSNAIKFTEDGCVAIEFAYRREEYGINLCVSVRDTGIGMKKEELEKICNNYYQADSNRNRQKGGIGLGMAISQAMIHKMGGYLSLESEYGRGTKVHFVVPQKVSDETPIVTIKNPRGLNVLCYVNLEVFELNTIRDEYTKTIQNLVKQNGVNFHMCKNMAEVKRRLEKERFTHFFIGMYEYEEDRKFFDELSMKLQLIVVVEQTDEQTIRNSNIRILYKPLYVLPVATILNGEKFVQGLDENSYHHEKFIAPEVKILAVDDNEINLMVLKGLLAPYKMQVVTATSGSEALDIIQEKDFDLILMDHMMPEMDGIETFRRIREMFDPYFKKVPVIALTANAIGGAREMFMEEGFQDFVSKPIEVSVLARVLRRNIPSSKIVEVTSYDYEERKSEEETANSQSISFINEPDVVQAAPTTVPDIIDKNLGVTYCGTEENLIEMVQMHCQKYGENRQKIVSAFAQEDWKNYQIHVHGLKSTMMSVGMKELSDKAKALEQACRENDTEYILNHHGDLLVLYDEQMKILGDFYGMDVSCDTAPEPGPEQEENLSDYEELSVEELEQFIKDFESVVYTFSAQQMLDIVHSMDNRRFGEKILKKELEMIVRKIENSDYMSAMDCLIKWKNNLIA